MRPLSAEPCRAAGFSLLEIALVLVLLGLLLGGALQTLAGQQQVLLQERTRQELQQVHRALQAFVHASGGRLPCPDRQPADGREDFDGVSGSCVGGSEGWLPYLTLGGTGRTDAWGQRLRYRVEIALAASPAPEFPTARMQVCGSVQAGGECRDAMAEDVLAVVLSHGANGYGGQIGSVARPAPPPSHVHEQANSDGDPLFILHEPRDAGGTGGAFDDQLVWMSLVDYHASLLAYR